MRMPITVAALCITATLSACQKTPPDPQPPVAMQAFPGSVAGTGADTSVPSAATVLTPAEAKRADPAAGRTNSAMNPAQESGAMPLPGQNNDHSAPQSPAKPASAR